MSVVYRDVISACLRSSSLPVGLRSSRLGHGDLREPPQPGGPAGNITATPVRQASRANRHAMTNPRLRSNASIRAHLLRAATRGRRFSAAARDSWGGRATTARGRPPTTHTLAGALLLRRVPPPRLHAPARVASLPAPVATGVGMANAAPSGALKRGLCCGVPPALGSLRCRRAGATGGAQRPMAGTRPIVTCRPRFRSPRSYSRIRQYHGLPGSCVPSFPKPEY